MHHEPPSQPQPASPSGREPMLRRALSAARMGTWEWDIASNSVTWSEELEALFGFPPGGFPGTYEAFLARVYPPDRPGVEQAVERALKVAGAAYSLEHRIVPSTDVLRWVESRGQVFHDGDGRPLCITGTVTDITDRKQVEEETAFLFAVLDAVSRAASLSDAFGEVLKRVCEATGWDAGQVWIPRADGSVLECGATAYVPVPEYRELREASLRRTLAPGEGMTGRAWQSRQLIWIRTGMELADLPRLEMAEAIGVAVALAVPVLDGEEVLAVLEFATRDESRAGARPLGLVTALAEKLGPALRRRRTEDALRQAERLHRETLERVRLIAVGLDLEGRVVFCNDALCRLTGYAREEVIGESWHGRFVPADGRAGLEELISVAVRLGEIVPQVEAEIRTRSGEWRTIAWHCAVLHDPAGCVVGISALGDDVTESRRIQEHNRRLLYALRERVKELTALHSAAGLLRDDGLPPLEQIERLAALLPPAFQFPGITAARVRVGSLASATPGFREDVPCLAAEFATGGVTGCIEVCYLEERPHEDEGPFLREERSLLDSLAEMLRTACDSRRSREALARSVERYHSLVAASAQIIWTTDRNGGIAEDIPTWRAFTGQSQEEMLAPGGWALPIHPEDRDRVVELWAAAVRDQTVYEVEYRLRKADGTYRYVLARSVPVRDAQGEVREWVGAATDITERVRLERQFLQSQKMEALGRLAGGIAHDFNNMLAVITGFTELSLMQMEATDPRRSYLIEVRRAGERAQAMTRQLLIFSRQERTVPQPVRLNDVAQDMHAMLQRLIGEDIRISLLLAEDLGTIFADPGQIEQVVMNLAVNARDAMPGGGSLIIETANLAAAPPGVPVSSAAELGYVQLSVTDTGTGIPPDVLAHIFEPFYTTKPAGSGTGLGLATVNSIVEQAGGGLVVNTEPEWGTTFRIFFPRVPDAPREGRAELERKAVQGGVETVLLVEDEAMVRNLVRSVLQVEGYTVLEAACGDDALRICETHPEPIHLLLTDVVIPDMSGREIADRVRSHRPETPVIYMTGYTDDVVLHRRMAEQTSVLLEKPFPPSVLTRLVRQVLDGEPP